MFGMMQQPGEGGRRGSSTVMYLFDRRRYGVGAGRDKDVHTLAHRLCSVAHFKSFLSRLLVKMASASEAFEPGGMDGIIIAQPWISMV